MSNKNYSSYSAVLDEDLRENSIHRDHIGHALSTLWLFLLLLGISTPAVFFLAFEIRTALWSELFWVAAAAGAICLTLFVVAYNAWYLGAQHLDAMSQEYRAEKKHQREMQLKEHELQTKRLKLLQASNPSTVKAPELPSMTLGRNLHVADPMQHSDVRIEVIPPRDYLVWQWTKGYEKRGEKRIPWGEERAERVWGAESDRWLEQLAIIGFIQERSADKKKPGALTHELAEVLEYFNYAPPSPIEAAGTPEPNGSTGSSSRGVAG